ncbi:MAG: preprotein translocase subunit SecG [Bacteroidota bacterium]
MFLALGILSVLIAVLLILAVVIQNSKGGGLSSTFGGGVSGASQLFGARRSNEMIEKITWYLAGALALIAFVANVIGASYSNRVETLRMEEAIEGGVQYNANPNTLINPDDIQAFPAPEAESEGE